MNHLKPSPNRRTFKTFFSGLIAYALIIGSVAPLAAAGRTPAARTARTSISERLNSAESFAGNEMLASVAVAPVAAPAPFAPSITATKTDAFADSDGDGRAEPGETITYTVTVTNNGADDATGVTFNDTPDPNTTLVANSVATTPVGVNDAYDALGNVRITRDAATGLLANDRDPDTGDNTGLTASGGTTSTQGGNVTINADGSFIYTPPAGFTGTDTFTYTVTDTTSRTDTATVTITVLPVTTGGSNVIYFINNTAPAGGDGRITSPFNSIAAFNAGAADEAGDVIFIYQGSGAYSGNVTLLNTQQLIGQGVALATATGVTPPTGSETLPGATANPTITGNGNIVTLGQNNTLRGVTLGDSTGIDLVGSNFGTLTTSVVTLNGTGRSVSLTNGTLAATFDNITSTSSSGGQGILLQQVAGSMTVNGATTITGAVTQGILVTQSTANISFGNTTVSGGTDGVSLQNNSAGTRSFGTLSISGNSSIGFLHANAGGATTAGATTVTNPTGTGIDIQSSNATVSFGATVVNKNSTNGTGVNLGGATSGNSAAISFGSLGITTANGTGLLGVNNSGSITVTAAGGGISSTNNPAINISAATGTTPLNLNFSGTTSSSSTTNAVNLVNTSGSAALGSGNLNGATGTTFNISGGSAAVSFGGITAKTSAGLLVSIASHTSGTITLNGELTCLTACTGFNATGNTSGTIDVSATSKVFNTGTNTAVTLANNTGATINFLNGGLDIDTTSGGGFSATGGGTINITTGTNTNTIDTTTGTALNVANTSIGASDLNFRSITSNGATRAISLNATGSAGGLTITGTGTTDGSGGTIQNITVRGAEFINASQITLSNMTFTNVGTTNGADPTVSTGTCGGLRAGTNTGCNAGIHMQGTSDVVLTNVDMNGGNQIGINGNAVTNFSLSNSTIQNFGDQVVEDGIQFQNLYGTSSVTNCTVTGNESRQIEVQNNATNGSQASLTVSGTTLSNSSAPNGEDGILFSGDGTANMKVTISSSTFSNLRSSGVFSDFIGNATGETIINTSTFNPCCPGGAIQIVKGGASNVRYNISNNGSAGSPTFLGGAANVININKQTTSTASTTIQGTINNNFIGNTSSTQSATTAGTGVRLVSTGDGTMTANVTNNTIRGVPEHGILASIQENSSASNPLLNVTITGNTINATDALSLNGIQVNGGSTSVGGNDKGTICADISGNNVTSTSTNIRLRQRFATTIRLPGYGGSNTDNTAVQNYLASRNTASTYSATNTVPTGGGFVGGASCTQSSLAPATLKSPPRRGVVSQNTEQTDSQRTTKPGDDLSYNDMSSDAAARVFRTQTIDANAPTARFVRASYAPTDDVWGSRAKQSSIKSPTAAPKYERAIKHAVKSPNLAPVVQSSGVSVNLGTLRAGDSVTITFQVTVNDPPPAGVTQVSNQGTVSGTNFTDVLTDDPATPAAPDPTVTLINPPPTINISDARAVEPASGSRNAVFTVSLSAASTRTVTVAYATADSTATAGSDYTQVSGTLTFTPGQTSQTISVPVLADAQSPESPETFFVNLSSPTNAFIGDAQGVGTIVGDNTQPANGAVLISEFRFNGPVPSGTPQPGNTQGELDEFIELYNNTDSGIDISGYSVESASNLSVTIPESTFLPGRSHYLIANAVGYSLSTYAEADLTYGDASSGTIDLPADDGLVLINAANSIVDAVGFTTTPTPYKEGTGITTVDGTPGEFSFVRKVNLNNVLDAGTNRADFQLVSTTAAAFGRTGTDGTPDGRSSLGAPGPQSLGSLIAATSEFSNFVLDTGATANQAPNRVRNTADPRAPLGTLTYRRRFVNNTGAQVTQLRLRVTDISTIGNRSPAQSQQAIIKMLSEGNATVTLTGGGTVPVLGTQLESPSPSGSNYATGGGLNASLLVTLGGGGIAPGGSFNLHYTFGIETGGTFRLVFVVESVPVTF